MARRRHEEEHQNHEAWAIPYGDLITLLLAFFVVMYALSTVNAGKYRVLSDSLVAAFRGAPKSLEPIQVGQLSRAFNNVETDRPRTFVPIEQEELIANLGMDGTGASALQLMQTSQLSADDMKQAETQISEIGTKISADLKSLIEADLVKVRQDRFWIEIQMKTSVLFPTASADINGAALPIVQRLGQTLAHTNTRIQVEGHTDSQPISTPAFPSNWELSAARAATVVRMFAAAGVEPQRLAAVGFGEFRPIADNSTEAGRATNRRVVVVVVAAPKPRFGPLSMNVGAATETGVPAGAAPASSPSPRLAPRGPVSPAVPAQETAPPPPAPAVRADGKPATG